MCSDVRLNIPSIPLVNGGSTLLYCAKHFIREILQWGLSYLGAGGLINTTIPLVEVFNVILKGDDAYGILC